MIQKQDKIFNQEYARELLRIAKGDLGSARILAKEFSADNSRAENIFFMAQQAVEKALKAVLCARKLPVPLVHDLGVLIGKIPADTMPVFGYELTQLTEFATVRRYEEGAFVVSAEEAFDVIKTAENIMNWAEKIVNAALTSS